MDVPTVRPSQCSVGIFPYLELVGEPFKGHGNQSDRISRRFLAGTSEPYYPEISSGTGSILFRKPRMGNKCGEISHRPCTRMRVLRSKLEYSDKISISAAKQNPESEERPGKNKKDRKMELANRQKTSRETKLRSFCHPFGASALKSYAKSVPSPATRQTEEKFRGCSKCFRGNKVVDRTPAPLVESISSMCRHFHERRCFEPRLGGPNRRDIFERLLESRRIRMAYKHKGAGGNLSGGPDEFKRPGGQDSYDTIGQSNRCLLHNKSGRHQISKTKPRSDPSFRIRQKKEYFSDCSLFTGNIQRHSRQPFSGKTNRRLDPIKECSRENFWEMGRATDRFIRLQNIEGCRPVRIKGYERPTCGFHRCLQSNMGLRPSLDVSSPGVDSQSSRTSKCSSRCLHTDCAEVGQGLLEVRPEIPSSRTSFPDSELAASPAGSSVGQTAASESQNTFGGLENTGWAVATKNWDREDRALLERAWRKSTLKTYCSPWKQWLEWCADHHLSPTKPEASSVARYLSYLSRQKNLAPATIKVHKSVITTFANPLEASVLSSNPLVQHMIKAIELSSPTPTKKVIWNVETLLRWMKEENIEDSNLFQISRRLALILLLASGRRIHDLTLLRIDSESLTVDEELVCFWPSFGSKTDNSSYKQSEWKLIKHENTSLDPVLWTKKLLQVSADRRKAKDGLNSLFITSRGKVGPASRAIIAGWVQSALRSAGINFSPGSIRSAVASTRRENNLPLDYILQCGNWRGKTNVFKHYFKEIQRNPKKSDLLCDNSFIPI